MTDSNKEIASKAASFQQKNRSNTTRLGFWTAIWLLSMALSNFGPRFIWDFNTAITTIMVLLNLALGLKMILSNIDHIKGLDELQQRIQLNAMAVTLGLSIVVGLTYSNLDVLKLINFHAEISHLVIFIGVTYLIATFIGNRKFQ